MSARKPPKPVPGAEGLVGTLRRRHTSTEAAEEAALDSPTGGTAEVQTPEDDAKAPTDGPKSQESDGPPKAAQGRAQGRPGRPQASPEAPRRQEDGPASPGKQAAPPPAQSALAWLGQPQQAVDTTELWRWQTLLNASAGKLGKTLKQARADYAAWERTVRDARQAGVDEDAIDVAAKRVGVPVPAAEDEED